VREEFNPCFVLQSIVRYKQLLLILFFIIVTRLFIKFDHTSTADGLPGENIKNKYNKYRDIDDFMNCALRKSTGTKLPIGHGFLNVHWEYVEVIRILYIRK